MQETKPLHKIGLQETKLYFVLLQPVTATVPPTIPSPPVIPSIASVPVVAPSIPRPLAPIPVRPPILRPSVAQNEETRGSRSDSNEDEAGPSRGTTGASAEYEISEESRLVRERQEKAMQELLTKRRDVARAAA